jgi:ubiquinone/menaquinone biosynthesis C-methylase UbiE
VLLHVEAAKQRLAKGYSNKAMQYDVLAGHLYRAGVQRLLPRVRVPPMPAILDVGSGTGVNLLEAARWFAPARLLCGIDLSPGMVEVARAKAAMAGVPAQFIVGDAEKLPYPDKTFDLVICNSVLHWFKDRQGAVNEMYRVLKPGGQVILICAASPGFREWFHLVDTLLEKTGLATGPSTAPAFPTLREVSDLMTRAGFLMEHAANPVQLQRIVDPEPFVQLMSTVAPHSTSDLSPENQARFQQLAAAALRVGWPGGFPNTWSALEAVGTRVR